MHTAQDSNGNKICARCGQLCKKLTIDHFVPRSCGMHVNGEGNYVGLCEECNHIKANHIVLPEWYVFLNQEQQKKLYRYMRYARSYILEVCEEPDIIEKVMNLTV